MFVDFLSLKFKNILSYGNKLITVDFTSGLNQIVGKNGQGKSTILDALSFCLYGKPYRDNKLDELINRTNKGNLYTETTFNINDDVFRIERGLKPDILKIHMNGKELDSLSSKRFIQAEIDNILSIDYTLFKEVICLAVNYNKPFLLLPKNDKRNLVENIFQIGIITKMLVEAKNRHKGNEVDYKLNKASVNSARNESETLSKYIGQMESIKNNFEENKQTSIDKIKKNIEVCEMQVKKCIASRNKGNDLLKNIQSKDKNELSSLKTKVSSNIFKISTDIEKSKSEIKLLKENSSCPFCYSLLDEAHKKQHTEILNENIEKYETEIIELKDKLHVINTDIELENENEQKKQKINKITYQIDSDEKYNKEKIKELTNQYDIKVNETFATDINPMRSDLKNKQEELNNLEAESKSLLTKIELTTKVIEVLSDNGIKAYFYKKYIPNLNIKINEYLNIFSLPVTLKFDEHMVEHISNIVNKKPINYKTFSAGEQKRIDISIMFSFIQIMKDIANWRCNILFLDEVLDSSTDDDGLVKILESLQNLIYNNSNLCIYVISHRMHNNDMFTNKIKIEKENGFSTIRMEV